LYRLPDIARIKDKRKEGDWLGHVEWMWHEHVYNVIRNP